MPYGSSTPSSPSLASEGSSRTNREQPSALLLAVVSRFGRQTRLGEPRYKLFWQTMAILASMSIFASLRPSTTEVVTHELNQSTVISSPKKLRRTISGARFEQATGSNVPEAALRESHHFAPKGFTSRVNPQARSIATVQKSEVTRSADSSVSHIRVVVD